MDTQRSVISSSGKRMRTREEHRAALVVLWLQTTNKTEEMGGGDFL